MDSDKHLDLIRKFGPSHINHFIHLECINSFTAQLPLRNSLLGAVTFFKPEELIGEWNDITSCDVCEKTFEINDRGYLRMTLMSLEELSGWITVREEKR